MLFRSRGPLGFAKTQTPNLKNLAKLYLHIGGNTPIAKWVLSDKLTFYFFIKPSQIEEQGDDDEEEEEEQEGEDSWGFECLSPRLESS